MLRSAVKVREKNPDHVPVICVSEKSVKLLTPGDMSWSDFSRVLRERVPSAAAEGARCLVAGTKPHRDATLAALDRIHRDADGFLYVHVVNAEERSEIPLHFPAHSGRSARAPPRHSKEADPAQAEIERSGMESVQALRGERLPVNALARNSEVSRLLLNYPDSVPVICRQSASEYLPKISKKMLAPRGMRCSELTNIIRRYAVPEGATIDWARVQVLVGGFPPRTSETMDEIYDRLKGDDGLLHITLTLAPPHEDSSASPPGAAASSVVVSPAHDAKPLTTDVEPETSEAALAQEEIEGSRVELQQASSGFSGGRFAAKSLARNSEISRLLAKHPDRVPMICRQKASEGLPDIYKKMLAPRGMRCSELIGILRKYAVPKGTTIVWSRVHVLVGGFPPPATALVDEIYESLKSDDGLLHLTLTLAHSHEASSETRSDCALAPFTLNSCAISEDAASGMPSEDMSVADAETPPALAITTQGCVAVDSAVMDVTAPASATEAKSSEGSADEAADKDNTLRSDAKESVAESCDEESDAEATDKEKLSCTEGLALEVSEACHKALQDQLLALTERLRCAEQRALAANARADASEARLKSFQVEAELERTLAAENLFAAEERAAAEHAKAEAAEAAAHMAYEDVRMARNDATARLLAANERLQHAEARAEAEASRAEASSVRGAELENALDYVARQAAEAERRAVAAEAELRDALARIQEAEDGEFTLALAETAKDDESHYDAMETEETTTVEKDDKEAKEDEGEEEEEEEEVEEEVEEFDEGETTEEEKEDDGEEEEEEKESDAGFVYLESPTMSENDDF